MVWRDYGVRQNYRREITPLSIQASFLVEGKREGLTDKLVRDFELGSLTAEKGRCPATFTLKINGKA